MKPRIILLCLGLLLTTRAAQAQWVVTDPTNLAQGIINSTKQIVEAARNGSTLLQSFQETVKIYEQGKRYYDALKAVNNLVRSARKVQQCMLLVGEISDIYVNGYQRMVVDDNFSAAELRLSPRDMPASSRSRPGSSRSCRILSTPRTCR